MQSTPDQFIWTSQKAGWLAWGMTCIHRGGIPWYDLPIPHENHKCKAQTYAEIFTVTSPFDRGHPVAYAMRCPCGGINHRDTEERPEYWENRNSRGRD